jgi:hypothetical protein
MTRKLEEIFGFDQLEPTETVAENQTPEQTQAAIVEIDADIDKIDAALPGVRNLDSSDQELDDIASRATETFENLTDLGMNVDSRFAAELFAVAGTMLGHALTAKQTKLQKKLKIIELQMKKLKLDQDQARMAAKGEIDDPISAKGQLLNRNDLLEMLKSNRDQNNNKA